MVEQQLRSGSSRVRFVVVCVLLLFGALAVIYSIVTPVFEGSDEIWHYAYVRHIVSNGELPRQPPEETHHLASQQASQPPLYYLLVSAFIGWLPADDLGIYLRRNPQFEPVPWGYRDNQNVIVHTDAERFPYQGTALSLHLARLVSVVLGLGTVSCTYVLARLLFPGQTALALAAMMVTALTPGFIFGSALVNNDSLIIFLSSAALVLLAKLWTGRTTTALVVVLGLLLGCAALTKLSGLLLWPFAGLMLAALAWRGRDWRSLVRVAVPVFLLASLVCGWWYLRNWRLYGDLTGLNMMLDIVGRREPGFGLRDVLSEWEGIRRSYWALFGWFNVPVAVWLYRVYDLLSLVALAGLGLCVVRAVRQRRWQGLEAVVFLALWFLINVVGLIRWTLITPGSQGRLVYPSVCAISILLVLGWLELLPRRKGVRRWFVVGVGGALLAVVVYVPFFVIKPAYAKPAWLSPEQVADYVPQESTIRFEKGIALVGYGLESPEMGPGDVAWVRACWQGAGAIEEDYMVFVQLLADNDLIAAQKDTYHGLGSFPTSLWPPGIAFCERYPLRVADTVPGASQGTISMGLYRSTGERLQAYTEDGLPLGDNVRFVGPRITVPDDERRLDYEWGHQVSLVNYQLDRTAVAPGESLGLSLFWQVHKGTTSDYVVTVQVLDEQNTKIGQSDIALPMSTWQPGAVVQDQRMIDIVPDAGAGVYDIRVGVYDPITIENLTVYRNRQVLPGGGLLTLWRLRVLPEES